MKELKIAIFPANFTASKELLDLIDLKHEHYCFCAKFNYYSRTP